MVKLHTSIEFSNFQLRRVIPFLEVKTDIYLIEFSRTHFKYCTAGAF